MNKKVVGQIEGQVYKREQEEHRRETGQAGKLGKSSMPSLPPITCHSSPCLSAPLPPCLIIRGMREVPC